jgi:hypothetical protein
MLLKVALNTIRKRNKETYILNIEKDFNHTETHFVGNRAFHSSIKSYDVLKIHIRKAVTYKSPIYWSTQ